MMFHSKIRLITTVIVSLPALLFTINAQIIPAPDSVTTEPGSFTLPKNLSIFPATPSESKILTTTLKNDGISSSIAAAIDKAHIAFAATYQDSNSPEAYQLHITPRQIQINAATPQGRFYGLQSALQLIATYPEQAIPCQKITDAPRFEWRGFMLDESRHFSGKEALKNTLDAMARYKLNRFHWHLTDSAGWRIEIKKYPKLTTIGSRGSETDRDNPNSPAQFYTQEEIKELVAYAHERHITVIPEIDMPGHADAAVRAYPELDGGGYDKWPHFTFNPAAPATFKFLDDVLAEVAALFPQSPIIHFGGDEVHFGWHKWTELPEVKELMEKEKLKDLAAVEAWFNRRMAAKINQLGFHTGGWDEITAREFPTDQTVIWWWRHDKPKVLQDALKRGYPVILCPRLPCYLDFVQDASHKSGRRWGSNFNPIENCYNFPESLKLADEQFSQIRGIQGNLWTETTVTQERRYFLVWPRLIALAEAAWTRPDRKDFEAFQTALKPQLLWLQNHGITPWDPFEKSPEIAK